MTEPTPEALVAQAYVEAFIEKRRDGPRRPRSARSLHARRRVEYHEAYHAASMRLCVGDHDPSFGVRRVRVP
jgi:hypothetical protein